MSYTGFFELRSTIAGIYSKEFEELYRDWCKPNSKLEDAVGNQRLEMLYKNGTLSDDDNMVLDFLFAPIDGSKISVVACKKLFELIKDYDNDIAYGYVAQPDCAMFKDFKDVVQSCIKNRNILSWQ